AKATDNFGATTMSAPISVTVSAPTVCVSAPPGLVAWWPGDDNAFDIVGKKNWTMIGGVTFAPGKVGQAFSLNGADGCVSANSVATTAVDNWSMAAWVYWKGPVGTAGKEKQTLLFNGNEANSGYGLIIPEQGLCSTVSSLCPEVGNLVIVFAGVGYVTTGVALDQNAWNHIALVRENGVLKLYKNGALVFSAATGNPNPPSATDGYTAICAFPGYAFNGLVDEIMFFNAAVDGDQVRSLFASDAMGLCKPLNIDSITAPTNGAVLLNISGQAGKAVTIYGSSDLFYWLPIDTVPNPAGTLQFTNTATGGLNSQFFKAATQ
ncbi:MAG TPA: LamG-like jellyroll fold domain-containing protein, partial [Candidatus Angelobacter sp.]|nr:LamG-like jellyroll fold domain-containing protein [Candidatus Angelobacter sp.]